jgi:hypothetical protein
MTHAVSYRPRPSCRWRPVPHSHLDDGPIAQELLSYSQKAIANFPFRLQLGRALLQAARDPRRAMIVLEQIADRLEGKPVQKLRHDIPHATYFYEAGKPKPPEVEEAERRKPQSTESGPRRRARSRSWRRHPRRRRSGAS